MIGFNQNSAAVGNAELIPAATLSKAVISVEEAKFSKPNEEKGTAGGGRYFNCKVTLVGAPYDKRVIFCMLMDPEDAKNSERAREMGLGHLVRIMEAQGIFDPANPASYRAMSFDQALAMVSHGTAQGKQIAVEIGVQKGTGGFADKNVIRNFLSPNSKSDTFPKWKKVRAGAAGPAVTAPVAFGAQPPSAPPQGGGSPFGAPPQQGFGQQTPGWLQAGQQPAQPAGPTQIDGDQIPF